MPPNPPPTSARRRNSAANRSARTDASNPEGPLRVRPLPEDQADPARDVLVLRLERLPDRLGLRTLELRAEPPEQIRCARERPIRALDQDEAGSAGEPERRAVADRDALAAHEVVAQHLVRLRHVRRLHFEDDVHNAAKRRGLLIIRPRAASCTAR